MAEQRYWYREGAVSVEAGSNIVTGTNTHWQKSIMRPSTGDALSLDGIEWKEISEITADGLLKVHGNFLNSATNVSYMIKPVVSAAPALRLQSQVAEVLGLQRNFFFNLHKFWYEPGTIEVQDPFGETHAHQTLFSLKAEMASSSAQYQAMVVEATQSVGLFNTLATNVTTLQGQVSVLLPEVNSKLQASFQSANAAAASAAEASERARSVESKAQLIMVSESAVNRAMSRVMDDKIAVTDLRNDARNAAAESFMSVSATEAIAITTMAAAANISSLHDNVIAQAEQARVTDRSIAAKAATVGISEVAVNNAMVRVSLDKTSAVDAATQAKVDALQSAVNAVAVHAQTAVGALILGETEELAESARQAARESQANTTLIRIGQAQVESTHQSVTALNQTLQGREVVAEAAARDVALKTKTTETLSVLNTVLNNDMQQTAAAVLTQATEVKMAQTQVGITYQGVTALNQTLQSREAATAMSERLVALKAKATETLSVLNAVLNGEIQQAATDVDAALVSARQQATLAGSHTATAANHASTAGIHASSAAANALAADQHRQSILGHRDAVNAIAAQVTQINTEFTALSTEVNEQAQQDITAMSNLLQQAQNAAAMAVRVAFDESPLQELPAPGKAPLAGGDSQIAEQWLNCEAAYSAFVVGFANLMSEQLQNKVKGDGQAKALADFVYRTDRAIAQIDKHLDKLRSTSSLPEELFQGFHAAGKSHRLPVFNMMERDFLAEAAQEEGYAEFLRSQGASGIVNTRQYQADRNFDIGYRVHDVSYATLNIHNHPNYKSQPGMAEIAACINGYYFRTRHMDYAMAYPIQGKYLERVALHAPEIPSAIAALPTGINPDGTINFANTQAAYMRDVKAANPQDCQWQLAYLECWLEQSEDDALDDPADSFRHANDAKGYREMFDKGRFLNASGHKNRLENLSYQPFTVRYVDSQGVPRFGTLQYRINSYPVGDLRALGGAEQSPRFVVGNSNSHYHSLEVVLSSTQMTTIKGGTPLELTTSNDFGHTHQVRVSWDGTAYQALDLHPGHQHPVAVIADSNGRLPYNEAKAVAGTIDSTNRFKLVRDLRSRAHQSSWSNLAKSRMARFECADLVAICEKLPGIQGDGAILEESYTQYGLNDVLDAHNGSGRLNAARYNRRYRFNRDDASGRVTANRGFNDPTLFVAKTTHPRVVGGFSWMIPLELILRTPRENWNPYQLPTGDYTQLKAEEAAGHGTTAAKPFRGINPLHFYYGTPVGVVQEVAGQVDPADTANTAWVKDANGIARQVLGNGIRVHDVDGVRQRYPIYPLFGDHSYSQTQQHWLRKTMTDLLKKAAAGTLTAADIDNNL